jgi:hypothetical protein
MKHDEERGVFDGVIDFFTFRKFCFRHLAAVVYGIAVIGAIGHVVFGASPINAMGAASLSKVEVLMIHVAWLFVLRLILEPAVVVFSIHDELRKK